MKPIKVVAIGHREFNGKPIEDSLSEELFYTVGRRGVAATLRWTTCRPNKTLEVPFSGTVSPNFQLDILGYLGYKGDTFEPVGAEDVDYVLAISPRGSAPNYNDPIYEFYESRARRLTMVCAEGKSINIIDSEIERIIQECLILKEKT